MTSEEVARHAADENLTREGQGLSLEAMPSIYAIIGEEAYYVSDTRHGQAKVTNVNVSLVTS